jgi:hypothetical protein
MAIDRGPALTDAAVLDAWEQSRALERPWRELALLQLTADPSADPSADGSSRVPIGERDRQLLALRRALFGRWILCETRCAACDERLELELDSEELVGSPPPGGGTTFDDGVRVRPPDSADVAAAMATDDPAATILERCVEPDSTSLPERARAAAIRRMAELDPAAELWLAATCPACGSTWTVLLDPAAIVVEEVDRHARQVLREVDQLARAYGWREPDVLALSRDRRRAYLGLVAS